MSTLRRSMVEYVAVRRALGYKLERTEIFLGQFLDYLDGNGAERITVEHALAWATLPGRGQHWHAMRLGAVRGFARYLHEVDPRVEVPAADLLPDKSGRAVPYLYADAQIAALIEAASTLRIAHKTATFQTLFGVLAATGMRVGEAVGLDRSDFDADTGTLTVRNAKFGKSRELPLHPTTTSALTRYLRRRDGPRPVGATEALLLSSVGTRLWMSDVQTCFRALRARAEILPRSAACRPTLHSLRHSFPVRTLLDAYRTDGDPASRLAALSTYLGHVNPARPIGICRPRPSCLSSRADAWNATSETGDERAR
jgi:integrase/recombinase XerD